MAVHQPSQYQVDNMQQGDIIYVKKQKLLYRIYRKLFLHKPKIKVKKYMSSNYDECSTYYQEDCTLLYYFEVACVQVYKNEVPVLIGTNEGNTAITSTILKSLQIGIYNVMLHFNSGLTLTIPVDYFDNGIRKNQATLKTINDQREIAELLKFQRYKGNYFKSVVDKYNLEEWIPAYCSVCGKPVVFTFKGDKVNIDNQCTCGELKIDKTEFTYDELSIWYYNQTNPTIKRLYEEYWFKRSS